MLLSVWSRFCLWFPIPLGFFFKLLGNVPRALTTIGITVTFKFYSYFSSLAISKYLSIFSLSFTFTLLSVGKIHEITSSCKSKLVWSSGFDDLFVFQHSREFNAFYFQEQILVCTYTIWWNMMKCHFLAQSSVDNFSHPVVPTHLFLLC